MKEEEQLLLIAISRKSMTPRDIIPIFKGKISHKRVNYLLEKWAKKGWYDYGVTLDLGWLTPEGITRANKLAATIPFIDSKEAKPC